MSVSQEKSISITKQKATKIYKTTLTMKEALLMRYAFCKPVKTKWDIFFQMKIET